MLNRIRESSSFAYIALALGIVCIGFSAIFVKIADVPGSVSSFYRVLIAGVALLPIWIYRGYKVPSYRDLWLIFIGAAFFSIDLFLWNTAILLTSAATATLLANNAPIWVALISLFIFRQKLESKFWVGLLLSLIGLNILVGLDVWQTMDFNRGDVLSIIAGFFYALYLLFTLDSRKRVDTVSFMFFSLVFMIIMLFGATQASGDSITGFSGTTWGALLGLGLVSHFLGWLSINYALGHLKGTNVSVTLLSQSVVTALVAIPLLGESLSVNQIVGGLLILSGVYYVNRRKVKS
ncbi:MAG: DMT family transporter [Bacteroidales bacterium]|nr:DMT family transporter [Bacteroidales bacterium]MDD4384053.1 DMT family transporter [Bacteroidales bacterium]MDY0197854.1 DMT family transporter [Tenuifilaceae bacterium]